MTHPAHLHKVANELRLSKRFFSISSRSRLFAGVFSNRSSPFEREDRGIRKKNTARNTVFDGGQLPDLFSFLLSV